MNAPITVTQKELKDYLLRITASNRTPLLLGSPGIGKSAIVEQFAAQVGIPCVSLLGSQLAPEDILGVPQIVDGVSRFCPPAMIARTQPYCLFLDEITSASAEIQKSFYSLIHERRVGEYVMPKGSIVIGAGNRLQDHAIVKPMSSALINRMVHIHLSVSTADWLEWATQNNIHPFVYEYIKIRPDHLCIAPLAKDEPFSTPRSWHMLSDALHEYTDKITEQELKVLAFGCLSPQHAGQFCAYIKQLRSKYNLNSILKGETRWPDKPDDRDLLYFLTHAFRARLVKDLPENKEHMTSEARDLAFKSKGMMRELAAISMEMAKLVVVEENNQRLPTWFLAELVRDLPRLASKE